METEAPAETGQDIGQERRDALSDAVSDAYERNRGISHDGDTVEAARDKLVERHRTEEAEADRARTKLRDIGLEVREVAEPTKITIVNTEDPSKPPAREDGTRINPRAGVGINVREAAAIYGQGRSQVEELHAQQAEELRSLVGDEATSEAAPQHDQSTAEQPAAVEPPEQPPVDPAQRQLAQQIERDTYRQQAVAAFQAGAQRIGQINHALDQLKQSAIQLAPELAVTDPSARRHALDNLRKNDPQRAAAFDALDRDFRGLEIARNEIAGHQQQLAAWTAAEVANDRAASIAKEEAAAEKQIFELYPELKSPDQERAFKDAMAKHLQDIGLSTAEFQRLRNAGQLNRRALVTLAKAAKWEMARAKGAEVAAKPLPPVMRPGVSHDRGSRNGANVAGLLSKANSQRGINPKEAARLMAARRGAR